MAEVIESAHRVIASVDPQRLAGAHVTGLVEPQSLDPDDPLIRFALSEHVAAIAASYLGFVPVLRTVDVWYSQHTDEQARGSRLYHCDGDDVTQVKVFVHCTNVEAESGPLTVLEASISRRIRRSTRYRFGSPRVDDERMHELMGKDQALPIIGPAGSVAFVDTTRCFHLGSRVDRSAGPRILAMFQYVTPFAFTLPGDHRCSAPYKHLTTEALTDVERLLLGSD